MWQDSAYLNGIKEVKVWDRVPAISGSDLDKVFETVKLLCGGVVFEKI